MNTRSRTFPPGTFVPTPLRVVAIIHLCIAFSALLFDMGYPFMGQLFENKRLNGIYENVLNESTLFQALPYQKQAEIVEGHQALAEQMHTPFMTKFRQAVSIILLELPPFQKAWIFFSILIPLLILLKIDGAHRAAWILPLITFIYAFNQVSLYPYNKELFESRLFPSEQTLLDDYLHEPLASNIINQKDQLLKGWQLFIVRNWTHETPSTDNHEFKTQFTKGLHAFNLARIHAINMDASFPPYLRKKGSFVMMGFFIWNCFFAWFVNRKRWFIA